MQSVEPRPPVYCAWRHDPDRPPCGERIVPGPGGPDDWWHWLEGNVLARRIDRGHGEHDPRPPDAPR